MIKFIAMMLVMWAAHHFHENRKEKRWAKKRAHTREMIRLEKEAANAQTKHNS